MSIEKIEMTNFRNHKDVLVDFSPGINIIWGENGSGKTSILEAVYLASNGKSFKTNKLSEAIQTGENETTISALFSDHKITIHQNKQALKKIKINNADKKIKDLIGKNPTVLVSPEEEKITKGPPLERSPIRGSSSQALPPKSTFLLRNTPFHQTEQLWTLRA